MVHSERVDGVDHFELTHKEKVLFVNIPVSRNFR